MEGEERKRPRLNFRPVLFCAFGLVFGVFLYGGIALGGLAPSDFLLPALLLFFALFPVSKKRLLALLLCTAVFAGAGALSLHLYTVRYENVLPEGTYRVLGRVEDVSVYRDSSVAVLGRLSVDGTAQGGKCRAAFSDTSLRPGDLLLFDAELMHTSAEEVPYDPYARNDFAKDIRYTAHVLSFEKTGVSRDPFLRFDAALYNVLHDRLGKDEADVAYALLTGNSGGMDEGLSDAVRQGGVAHIFAVSGLHIGILYSAVYFCCRPLKKYRFLPALFAALLYCALCGFSVSSVRAAIMCGVLGTVRALGRKHDFLNSISLAAIPILLFLPAQWYAAGMRLSFGACLGLALFSGSFSRLFSRLKFPRFAGNYLSAALSVQIFTLPVMFDAFGYVSAWGILLNLLLIPLVPALFLVVLLSSALALIIPPAAPFFLLFPRGMLSAFLFLFSRIDVSFVITGFALGAGAAVWLVGTVFLSERFRLAPKGKGILFGVLAVLFTLAVVSENVVFTGCRIEVMREGGAALVRTADERVLVLGGDVSLADCEDFLRRTYGGTLDAVVVLSEDEVSGANVAAFLDTREIRLKDGAETGLRGVPVRYGGTFSYGGLTFRYLRREKLVLFTEGLAVEFTFEADPVPVGDLAVGPWCGHLKYFLKDGIIKEK